MKTLVKQLAKTGSTLALLAGLSSAAQAGLIYSDFVHEGAEPVDYRVEVQHNQTAGQFDVTYQVTSDDQVSRLTGIFLTISNQYSAANLGLANEFNPGNELSCNQSFGVSSSNEGCNTNLNEGVFDIAIVWDKNNLTLGNGIGGFSISDLGQLTLADFGAIGLRAQGIGSRGESAKEVQFSPDAPAPVVSASEPGSLALALVGLAGLISARRRAA